MSPLLILSVAVLPSLAFAQRYQAPRYQDPRYAPPLQQPATTATLFGLTPQLPLGYDTGGDNDKHPERPPSQQGGGQQTGGPARNLIPGDGLHLAPR